MKHIWQAMEIFLASHPHISLRSPANHQDIQLLEKNLGYSLPADFKEYLKIHNGENSQSALFTDFRLLGCEEILKQWRIWKELLAFGDFDENITQSDEGIKNDWWNNAWIPITCDEEGNHVCIDLSPSTTGTLGQIIQVWHDSPKRELLAENFTSWLSQEIKKLISS